MTHLECKVTSCAHYQSGRCSLPGIHVSGSNADTSSQTCCASYEEKRGQASMNQAGGHAGSSSSIRCEAGRCQYNCQGSCEASNVCVDCCCGNVTNKSETECSTFSCR